MATMNVSLPDRMKDWVESRTQDGKYSNASDYVRDLIRKDQERMEEIERLQKLISEGIDSGPGKRDMESVLSEARQRAGLSGDAV